MATITVSDQKGLEAALKTVQGGDTILLGTGSYDAVSLVTSRAKSFAFADKVTIASADPDRPAAIGQLLVRGAANVAFEDVVLDYQRATKPGASLKVDRKFLVDKSAGVTFDGVTFDGEKRAGYGDGVGLRVQNSSDVAIVGSTFVDFEMALSMANSKNTLIARNDIRGVSFDAMMFAGMQDITIADNSFTAFHSRHLLHQDVIQFVTSTSSAPSSDIEIVGNYIDNPEETHGIYLGNSLYKDKGDMSAYYKNVYIADNVIRAADKLAIAVMHGDNVTIQDNILTKNNDEGVQKNIPLINVSLYSKNVFITDNTVGSVQPAANGSWVVEGNTTIPGRYEHWTGVYSTTKVQALLRDMPTSPAEPYEPEFAAEGPGAKVRVTADAAGLYDGGIVVADLDFADGDRLVFAKFDRHSFEDKAGGNRVDDFHRGAGVRIDSALDLQELVAFSPDVHAYATATGDLVVEIVQDAGLARAVLLGLGEAFLAAYQPELF